MLVQRIARGADHPRALVGEGDWNWQPKSRSRIRCFVLRWWCVSGRGLGAPSTGARARSRSCESWNAKRVLTFSRGSAWEPSTQTFRSRRPWSGRTGTGSSLFAIFAGHTALAPLRTFQCYLTNIFGLRERSRGCARRIGGTGRAQCRVQSVTPENGSLGDLCKDGINKRKRNGKEAGR